MEGLLRVAADATPNTPSLKTKPALAAHLLRQQLSLDVPENAKLPVVIAATVCKTLGFPGISDYKTLEARVLEKLLGTPAGLTPAAATEQFIRHRLGARQGKPDEIRTSALRRWLAEEGHPKATDSSGDREPAAAYPTVTADSDRGGNAALADFARRAVEAAGQSATGWFGDNKVFISHAWKGLRSRGEGHGAVDLAEFKQQLLRANTAGLLELSRADLVALMDPADVRESETRYLNTSFHFILLERGRQ